MIYSNGCLICLKFEPICRKKRVILGTAFHIDDSSDDEGDDDDDDVADADDVDAADDDGRTICSSNGGCGVGGSELGFEGNGDVDDDDDDDAADDDADDGATDDDDVRTICSSNGGCGVGALGGSLS